MKMKFTAPQINIEMFMMENIITTSGTGEDKFTGSTITNTDGYSTKQISWKDMQF